MEHQQPAAPPLTPPRLSAAAASLLHTCIAGMSASSWLDPGALHGTLGRAEGLICALRGCGSLAAYLQLVTGAGGAGGPCTCVWTAGTIAYRCRTCGLSPSAAICVDCFRASDHEGHDYTMYTSDAGGCCDCGDLSSWRPTGCCPRHRPPGEGQGAAAAPEIPAADALVLRGIVGCALVRLQLALEACLHPEQPGQAAVERACGLRLIGWLCQLAQAPAVRSLVCEELLLPATSSAAAQAGLLAQAAEGGPPEAAAVGRMLQQQREALLQRLAAVLPVPGEAGAAAGSAAARHTRPLPLPAPGAHQLSLLYWQVSTVLPLEAQLVEELATLHILLLYCVPFKAHFGRVLVCFYPHLGVLGKRHAVTKALDRLTVQVFHLEETTLELTQRDGLLEVLLHSLLSVLRREVGADGRLDGDSNALNGRHYLRIAADLHMCLSHPAVVLQLLGGPQAGLFAAAFLQVFRLIEGASPFRRKLGEHVLYESTAWVNIVQLEVHMNHMLKQGVLHTLMKAAEAGDLPAEAAAAALGFALQCSLAAVEAAAGPLQTAEEPHTFWANVLSGRGEISAHIPLERLAASCLAGLLHLGQTSPTPGPYIAAAAEALGSAPGMAEADRSAAARRWEMCGVAAERVLAWMSQIRQRLWVRNGQQLLRLEAFYSSPYWSDHGVDCDLLAVQAWQASTLSISRALGFFAVDGSGLRLLRASAAASLAEAVGMLQDARQSQEMLRCLADWLRLMVMVLRERSVWHPTYSPMQLRRALVHILAVGPRSHSEVGDELPYELAHTSHFDEVLAGVADYRPPTASTTGRYTLKRSCWREFDPFFPHYTRRDLETALHTAQEGGTWQPEWQLEQGLPPLPPPMAGLQRMLHHLLRLIWTSLLLACTDGSTAAAGSAGGGAAEDCALAAAALLCLVLQRKQADFEALVAHSSGSGTSEAAGGASAGAGAAAGAETAAGAAAVQSAAAGSTAMAGAAAAAGAAPPPPLPAAWATPAGFRQKVEEYLTGSPPQRPGILFLLRVLAGGEAWVDGSQREASWELKRCAAAATVQAQRLLQTVRRHAAGPEEEQQQQEEQQAGQQEQRRAAGAAGAASPAVQAAALAAADAAAVGAGAGPAGEAAAAGVPPAGQAEEERQRSRKAQAKQRQQKMLARMRSQQAKAAAALLTAEGEGEEGGSGGGTGRSTPTQQRQEQQQAAAEPAPAGAMEVDGGSGGGLAGEAGSAPTMAAASTQRQEQEQVLAPALPAHHPAAWEQQAGAECALCHSGGEAAPLGLVAQLQVTELPLLASADSPAPLTPEHPGMPAGAVGAPSDEEQELGAGPFLAPFPAPGAGPRLSVFDRQPSLHMLCCGHMLHAACLERYRSSWRQRVASGQFVEGFQLLQASTSSGEYLCPICRRLGNCLLPLAAAPAPGPASSGEQSAGAEAQQGLPRQQQQQQQQQQAEQQQQAPVDSQEGLRRLEGLILGGESHGVSLGPTAADAQLAQRWQQAVAESSSGGVGGGGGRAAGLPESLRLVPQFGIQAAGVADLCEFARLLGTKWILQQHRLLEWLQQRAPLAGHLWGIPTQPAPEAAAAPAGEHSAAAAAAAAAAPAPAPGQPGALQAALQNLLQHAAATDDGAAQALEAFMEAAAGGMGIDIQIEQGLDEEGSEGEAGEEEGSEGEEEGQAGGVPGAGMGAAAGLAAVIEQLQQQAAAAADDAAAAAEPSAGAVLAGAAAAGAGAGAAAGGPIQLHNRRLWGARVAGNTLWSLLGSGIVQWEVAHRDPAVAPATEVDTAHWRALQSLAQLALASGTAAGSQQAALHLLRQLAAGSLPPGATGSLPTDATAALLPSLLQLQLPPAGGAFPSDQDTFALLLQLLAALLTQPAPAGQPSLGLSLSCSAHAQPAAVLGALLAVLYPAAAGQALCVALGSAGGGGGSVADAVAAMAVSPPLASALEGAASTQLLPWLQRASLLAALLSGGPAPRLTCAAPGGGPAAGPAPASAAAAVSELLQRLRLPPLAAALRHAAAGSLPCSGPPAPGLPGPLGVQFSIHAAQRQWDVVARPLPAAAQLLQLPTSFQAWYLSMGSQRCSACGQVPAEPALCLRCGAVLCCGGRRCHGPTQQGMCYTHSLACGGGTCCFLLPKLTRLLVIRKNRATFLASPYVDSHGEEDLRLQRGKPLSLHAERARHLVQLWRSAALDFDSQVLHAANHRNEFATFY